ncbi:MAG: hypothetical protein IJN53_06275 [Oscillospiraceae bacterium]|nr:hypothetical protein [Oscillospiraceae bacterium]
MSESKNSQDFWQKFRAFCLKVKEIACKVGNCVGHAFKIVYGYCFRLRKIILAVPVIGVAVWLASYCRQRMPDIVGIGLKSTGDYAFTISRDAAVLGPLAITFFCLIMMFCSRRTLYPWLISVFTLILPIFIMATNMVLLPF